MAKVTRKKILVDVSEVWPQEREFIEKPERFKYIRRLKTPDTCVFCEAQRGAEKFSNLVLYKNKMAMVVLNKFPYNNGHVLVLPTRHVGQLTHLKKTEYQAVMNLLKATVNIIEKTFETENLNLGMNQGAVSGAGIPDHLHWHIIPRWMGDTNFFPLIAETKVHPRTLEQVYKLLRPQFKKMES